MDNTRCWRLNPEESPHPVLTVLKWKLYLQMFQTFLMMVTIVLVVFIAIYAKSDMEQLHTDMEETKELIRYMNARMDSMDGNVVETNKAVLNADSHARNIVYNTYELCKIVHELNPDKYCHYHIGYNDSQVY
eukprot:CAMPEP_0170176306 /NCGR_PEP_ID=MMETSP0040_2-20121228/9219_1 /TAXON_ID=641309 /ORGANISM="Lotharella oceanica, Strain CCMP622" /LENGTH=131 /DNA_ID=CAMNT_0010418587 /DNA_START=203 /DNA_END=598 /DNA_ORIENTATION=+